MTDENKKQYFHALEDRQGFPQLGILGAFVLIDTKGKQILIASKKNRALLAALALSPSGQVTRERLCGLLWGDRGEEQARSSLRQSLAVLRKELGDAEPLILQTRDDVIGLRKDILQIDVAQFLALSSATDTTLLRQAALLYRGELLSDTFIRDAAFGDWLAAEQRRLADCAMIVLARLAEHETGQARIECLQRLIDVDNLREASHRALILAYSEAGENGLALKQYEVCKALLQAELGVEPAPETLKLKESIFTNRKQPVTTPDKTPLSSPSGNPVIAVLPFTNLSGETGRQYLADGIAEDIVTELSRYRSLLVIASNSSLRFRDSAVELKEIGRQLGATHAVRGSLRLGGGRLRLSVQLVDIASNTNLWAEHFDNDDKDLLDIQDQIASSISAIVERRVWSAESQATRRKPMQSWDAHDHFLRGRDLSLRYRDDEALPFLDKAVELAPENAAVHAWRAIALVGHYFYDANPQFLHGALVAAHRALSLDEQDARVHHALGLTELWRKQHDAAYMHYQNAMRLNPGDVLITYDFANLMNYMGRSEEAMHLLEQSRQRDPFPPGYVTEMLGNVLFQLGRYQEAIKEVLNVQVDRYWYHAFGASAYAHLGKLTEARQQVNLLLAMKPGADIGYFQNLNAFKSPDIGQKYFDGLRKAGLPERIEVPFRNQAS